MPPFLTEKNKKLFFLVLTLYSGLLILSPQIDFLPQIATGDHGRDFYAFESTMNGAKPYTDYWWVYGPFMPYVYGFFLKICGVTMMTVAFTKSSIVFLSGLLVFEIMSLISGPAIAFLASLWFFIFHPDFFYTFNHIGGTLASLFIVYQLLRYVFLKNEKAAYLSLAGSFILAMIKINFGFAVIALIVFAVALNDWIKHVPASKNKKLFYSIAVFLLPASIVAVYFLLLKDLPLYAVRQCMPFMDVDQPYNSTIISSIKSLFMLGMANFNWQSHHLLMAFLFLSSCFLLISRIIKKNIPKSIDSLLALTIICAGYLLFMHEFFKSAVVYRSFWARPFAILVLFSVIFLGTQALDRRIKRLIYFCLFLLTLLSLFQSHGYPKYFKNGEHYVYHPKGKVFIGNETDWIKTVQVTTDFLESRLKADETFFALPYDVLFYYLTGRPSPTRQLIFFDHINIPEEQEKEIINELQTKKVKFVVMSNRAISSEPGLGTFGKTYCQLLSKYIEDNFKPVLQTGVWGPEPGWSNNLGIIVLERK